MCSILSNIVHICLKTAYAFLLTFLTATKSLTELGMCNTNNCITISSCTTPKVDAGLQCKCGAL